MSEGRTRIRTSELIARGLLQIGDGYRAKNAELAMTGLPFARAGNIQDGFRFEGADRFPEEDLARVGEKVSRPGDVVFTSKGTVGRFARVRPETEEFVYSPQLCYWRSLDWDVIDPTWLYYWMRSPEFERQFRSVSGQTDMAEYVSLGDQRRMFLNHPPLPEQRAIAEVLGALDDKIELNERMNATLDEMARAMFKSWFVDFDPVRAKAEGRQPSHMDAATARLFPASFEDSPLGPIPVGWRVESLSGIADFLNGLALQKFPAKGDDYLPVIKIAEMRRGYTSATGRAASSIDPRYIVSDGDMLFSWSGSLEVRLWTLGRGALNQHLFKVTSEHYPRWFYYHWTLQHLPEFQAIAAGKATTMGHIQRHHLSDALVVVPPVPLLEAGSSALDPLLELQVRNGLESRTLAELRDALLPKLISGEIRVGEVDPVGEVAV